MWLHLDHRLTLIRAVQTLYTTNPQPERRGGTCSPLHAHITPKKMRRATWCVLSNLPPSHPCWLWWLTHRLRGQLKRRLLSLLFTCQSVGGCHIWSAALKGTTSRLSISSLEEWVPLLRACNIIMDFPSRIKGGSMPPRKGLAQSSTLG